ncbi:MAG: hypothetical protein HRU19_03920 [Pseudobacteriovorax sp.]|nr:hypothetical protein [Pseudobacteriovorax sp.]
MNEYVLYVAIGLAILSSLYALITRKELGSLKALADNAAAQTTKEQRLRNKAEQSLASLQSSYDSFRDQTRSSDKKLDELKKKLYEKEQEGKEVTELQKQADIESQRRLDILSEENTVLKSQLAEAVSEKKRITDEAANAASKASKTLSESEISALQKDLESLKKTLNQTRKENKIFKSEVEKAREILRKVNPGELKRTKAKLSRVEQLYRSMKGLREMADERNENWETALRALAAHITANEKAQKPGEPLGPLVGEALEKIGLHLVIDEHSEPALESKGSGSDSDEGGSAQSTMDLEGGDTLVTNSQPADATVSNELT